MEKKVGFLCVFEIKVNKSSFVSNRIINQPPLNNSNFFQQNASAVWKNFQRKKVTCSTFPLRLAALTLSVQCLSTTTTAMTAKSTKTKEKRRSRPRAIIATTTTATAATTIARAVTVTSLATTVAATAIALAVLPASPLLTTRVLRRRRLRLRLRLRRWPLLLCRRRCRLRQFRLKRFSRGNSSDFRHRNNSSSISSSSKVDLRFSSRLLVAAP